MPDTDKSAPPAVLQGIVDREALCREFDCSTRTILRYELQGLPVIRRGRLRLYSVDAVRAWLLGERRRAGRAA